MGIVSMATLAAIGALSLAVTITFLGGEVKSTEVINWYLLIFIAVRLDR